MRHALLVLSVAALALPACAGKPAPSDRAANTAASKKEKEKPKYITMEEMYENQDTMAKGPGLFSGKDGYFTIYSREGPGSADPSKPVKVRRERR